jgi:hypothetical protein
MALLFGQSDLITRYKQEQQLLKQIWYAIYMNADFSSVVMVSPSLPRFIGSLIVIVVTYGLVNGDLKIAFFPDLGILNK